MEAPPDHVVRADGGDGAVPRERVALGVEREHGRLRAPPRLPRHVARGEHQKLAAAYGLPDFIYSTFLVSCGALFNSTNR